MRIKAISLPKLTTAGNRFLYSNKSLATLNLPALTTVGNGFLYSSKAVAKEGVLNANQNHQPA